MGSVGVVVVVVFLFVCCCCFVAMMFLTPGVGHSTAVIKVLLYVHRNRRFIREGSPGRPLPLSHSS